MKEVKLTVEDGKERDAGRGIARIDQQAMQKLGISVGAPIEIVGKKKTVAIAWPCYEEDKKQGVIRIDDFTRKNAGLLINKHASIRPAKVEDAQRLLLAPIDMRLNVDEDFTNFVKNRLMERVFFEGDSLRVALLGHPIPFKVIRAKPRGVPIRVSYITGLTILNEPFRPLRKPEGDIKYLLRIDWLKHLASRIKATKVVFSIADYAISDEQEQKVIDEALKIVEDNLSNVSIEVTFESKGTIIGTLPWAEIDIYGRVIAAYPDIQLPPLTPSITPEGNRGKVVPPMERCFKTGVKKCPKEINFSLKSVVIAMPFRDEFEDPYKYAIRPALEESGFRPWKANEQISNIDIMCKICQAIQESGYVLANITDWNPNVVFELGLAYGLGRNVILIK
ncbi:MAG: hypothetical protein ACETVQ_02185, partial [Candidatus Bathyarchaeia archaeon]